MSDFSWLNPGRWLLYAALAGALVLGAVTLKARYDDARREEGRQEVRAEWNAEKLAQAAVDAQETKRRLERQGDAQRENAQELARYRRAAADAVAARDGLRQLVDNLEAIARHGSRDTATADERQTGAAAAGMLADVSRGADDLAELYARTADESRRAGILCERHYDALTP